MGHAGVASTWQFDRKAARSVLGYPKNRFTRSAQSIRRGITKTLSKPFSLASVERKALERQAANAARSLQDWAKQKRLNRHPFPLDPSPLKTPNHFRKDLPLDAYSSRPFFDEKTSWPYKLNTGQGASRITSYKSDHKRLMAP